MTTRNFAADRSPAWSPDGTRIAFERGGDILIADSPGRRVRRLAKTSTAELEPSWSPDGALIVYPRGSRTHAIAVRQVAGGKETRLTEGTADDTGPVWSPDGAKIAFASNRFGSYDIFSMSADGTGIVDLTSDSTLDDLAPSWSPDGRKIAFASGTGLQTDIFVMNADGSDRINVTHDAAYDAEPSWSPDGTRIALTRFPDWPHTLQVFVMRADGTDQRVLVSGSSSSPSWAPDGREVAYSRNLSAPVCCLGVQSCHVPPIVGLGLRQARIRIRRSWCGPGETRYIRSSRARGRVIQQYPPAGARRVTGACVYPVVSRGRR